MLHDGTHLQTMRMHALNQTIQRRHFPVLVKRDHVPPLPAFSIFAKEPFLHNHIGVQPEIPSPLEQPVLSTVCVELFIVAVALFCTSIEMSEARGRERHELLRSQSFRFRRARRLSLPVSSIVLAV